jgi:hypothetical protein
MLIQTPTAVAVAHIVGIVVLEGHLTHTLLRYGGKRAQPSTKKPTFREVWRAQPSTKKLNPTLGRQRITPA